MKNKTVKNAIILFIIISLLFILFVGVILLVKSKITSRPIDESDVSYVGDNDTVSINRVIAVTSDFGRSISEENAGAFGYLEFDVVNHSDYDRNYQIFATKEESKVINVPSGYVILYLTDDHDNPLAGYTRNILPSYNNLHYLKNKADSKEIFYGKLKGNETAHFKLRVWVSEDYVVQGSNDSFVFKIDAHAV